MTQLYTVADKKTGEILFSEKTSEEIAARLGVKTKRVSSWATDGCRQYKVTTKYQRSKKARTASATVERIERTGNALEEKVALATRLGISYGKLIQGEMLEEYKNEAWKFV